MNPLGRNRQAHALRVKQRPPPLIYIYIERERERERESCFLGGIIPPTRLKNVGVCEIIC